jgi:hypothetical protein
MITIYSNTITGRLSYILKLIFNDLIGIGFELTSDREKFMQRTGPKIAYSQERLGDELLICPAGLVFEKEIKPQVIEISEWQGLKIFFQTASTADLPFDIFSASFLMVVRYKEYLPYQKSKYRRFEATESLACQYGFLEEPVVEQWSLKLKEIIRKRYPEMEFSERSFRFVSTIDVDNAYAFRHKSFLRTAGALLRSLLHLDANAFLARVATVLGNNEDPYNTYGYIDHVEKRYGLRSMFFFLVGDYSRYDTNISIRSLAFRNLIKSIAADHMTGIHPSMASHRSISILQKEVNRLAHVLDKKITKSRQHFLAFELPTTYQRLIQLGILEDYSMGYASHPGFRAGLCTPYRFYNLLEEKETDLTVYPFQVMDVTLQQYLRLNPGEAVKKIRELMDKVKKVNGTFVSLWHNESLSDKGVWKGWRKVFEETVRMGTGKGQNEIATMQVPDTGSA